MIRYLADVATPLHTAVHRTPLLAVSSDQLDQGQSGAKRTGQMGKGGRKRGTGSVGPKKRNGRKGVGTQGRRYVRLIMRESEEEKTVHAYNLTAHVLYKGMENM